MKIHHFKPVEHYQYRQSHKNEKQDVKVNHTDQVQISAEAKKMQSTQSYVVEREAKVAELKQRIQEGTYEIDPKAIAEGMLDFYPGLKK